MKRIYYFFAGILMLSLFNACSSDKSKTTDTVETASGISEEKQEVPLTETNNLTLIVQKNTVHWGESVTADFVFTDTSLIDSVVWYRDGRYQGRINTYSRLQINTANGMVGMHQVKIYSFSKQGKETDAFSYTVYAAHPPKKLKWKVINEYKHSVTAYTQGLFFADNYLYEGTGQWGQSSLKKINLKTGEVLQSYNLSNDIFGEGIVKYKDEIIQLTWQSHEAFVYDYKSFRLKNRFTYDTEGWGITNWDDSLLMSDGSNRLYVLDPSSFMVLRKIQVYDDKGAVTKLNELENINGRIFANVYLTNKIVVVNPKTGEVDYVLDLKGILPKEKRTRNTDVLNGIAWNKETKQLVITGKNWPLLYEIKLSGIDL